MSSTRRGATSSAGAASSRRSSSPHFSGARVCDPQQRPNFKPAQYSSAAFWLTKLLRVADSRSTRIPLGLHHPRPPPLPRAAPYRARSVAVSERGSVSRSNARTFQHASIQSERLLTGEAAASHRLALRWPVTRDYLGGIRQNNSQPRSAAL